MRRTGQVFGRTGQSLALIGDWPDRRPTSPLDRVKYRLVRSVRLGAAQASGQVANFQPAHFVFQGTERNAEVPCRGRHALVRPFERPQDEVTLEGVAGGLKQRFATGGGVIEPREVVFKRQVLFGDPIPFADGHETLD